MLFIKKILIFIIIFLFSFSTNAASDKLNKLFDDLYDAKSLTQAEKIEDKIWKNWTKHPKSEYLTSKLENGTYSMYHQQYRMALKLFTDVINEDPKWAEGWNKRATLLFIMGNYEKSLDDIERVLDLEPRHFGALSGKVIQIGTPEQIVVNPADEYVADFVKGISRLKVVQAKTIMQSVESYENSNGKLIENLQSVDEHELLSKLIEVSKSKDKPLVVKNNEQKNVGVITQSDLLKAVIEGGDGE